MRKGHGATPRDTQDSEIPVLKGDSSGDQELLLIEGERVGEPRGGGRDLSCLVDIGLSPECGEDPPGQ